MRNKPCGGVFSINGIVGITVDERSVIRFARERSEVSGIGKCTVYDTKVLYCSALDNAKYPCFSALTKIAAGHDFKNLMVLSVIDTGKRSGLAANGIPALGSCII